MLKTTSKLPKLANLPLTAKFSTSACLSKNPYIFYDLQRKQPRGVHNKKSFKPATTSTLTFDTSDRKHDHLTAQERAELVFGKVGSRKARREDDEKLTRTIAGVRVPPRPQEPENCCMSGCINCVWEMYKEDIDHWQGKRQEAYDALVKTPGATWPADFGTPPACPETNPDAKDEWDDVDVSIKVFLDTEKRLRKKKQAKKIQQMEEAGKGESATL